MQQVLAVMTALCCLYLPALAQGFWEHTGLFGGVVYTLAKAPDGTLYAGTDVNGVFSSTNNGVGWQASGCRGLTIKKLLIAPDGTIYAAACLDADNPQAPEKILRSGNGGASWDTLLHVESTIRSMAVNASGALCVLPRANCCKGGKVYTSTDKGAHWQLADLPDSIACYNDLEAGPGGKFYLAGDEYLLSSGDGLRWEPVSRFAPNTKPTMIWELAATDRDLFVIVGNMADSTMGLWRREAGNDAWKQVLRYAARKHERWWYAEPHTLFAAGSEVYFMNQYNQFFHSSDRGAGWDTVATLHNGYLSFTVAGDNSLVAGIDGGGVLRSRDKGGTWQQSSNGMRAARVFDVHIGSDGVLLAGGRHGSIYRSPDGGRNWYYHPLHTFADVSTVGHTPEGSALSIGLRTEPGGNVLMYAYCDYFAGADQACSPEYRYSDPNNRSGVPANALHCAAAYSYQHTHFALSHWNAGYRSDDDGATFQEIPFGSDITEISNIAIDAEGYVYAGSHNGVLRSAQRTTDLAGAQVPGQSGDVLSVNGSYPTAGPPELQYTPAAPGTVHIAVYNSLGQKLATLADTYVSQHPLILHWDAAQYAAGVYYCRAERAGQVITLPFVVR